MREEKSQQVEVLVWDLPTRIFHWALVLFVCVNLFLVDPEGGLTTIVHFVSGFIIAGLLLFRVVWGFVGSLHSRFADFIYRPKSTIEYARLLFRRRPPRMLGHNPLGGWMIIALLGVLVAMVGTGLFSSSRRAAGPLAHYLTAAQSANARLAHSIFSNVLIALIIGHLAGIAFDWLITREYLVRAMFSGRKAVEQNAGAASKEIAPIWRAIVIALVASVIVVVLTATTDYTATRETLNAIGG